MPQKICTFSDHAELTRKGNTTCLVCDRSLETGPKRCPHGNLWEFRGYCTVCQSEGVKSPGKEPMPKDWKLKAVIAEVLEEPRVSVAEIEPDENEVEETEIEAEQDSEREDFDENEA
ncbi:MAG: hypothetical protein ACYDCM_07245 [Candidatus Acidiferrales bacterium]